MIKYIFLSLFVGLIFMAVYLWNYLGMDRSVQISKGQRGPFLMLYKKHMGAYHHIMPTISAVEKWATDNGASCSVTFGEFLDDPAAVDQDRLRSRGGCFLRAPLAQDKNLPEGFAFESREPRQFVIARFSGAPSVGPFKVYPEVEDYLETHRLKKDGAVIEVYHVNGSQVETEYLFPILW